LKDYLSCAELTINQPHYCSVSPKVRVGADHPMRAIHKMADEALKNMTERFDAMYTKNGRRGFRQRNSQGPQFLWIPYSIRGTLLREEIDSAYSFDSGNKSVLAGVGCDGVHQRISPGYGRWMWHVSLAATW
jgi:hypothetical protein